MKPLIHQTGGRSVAVQSTLLSVTATTLLLLLNPRSPPLNLQLLLNQSPFHSQLPINHLRPLSELDPDELSTLLSGMALLKKKKKKHTLHLWTSLNPIDKL
jgi:hypothetical protein